MRVEWDKLRVFYYVAKFGSITKAADKLNISQPALSKSIQHLELRAKHALFHRGKRGVVLTQEGEILFEAIEKVFITIETAKTHMEEVQEPRGLLKIATTVALANLWLVELIPDFLVVYPDIQLEIIGCDEKLDMKTREADVSIRPFMLEQPDFIQDYLFSCCLKLYASPEYIEKYGAPQTVQDLDNHKIIVFGESTIRPYRDLGILIDWHLRYGLKEGEVRKSYITINSSQGATRFAERGLGIVALSKEFPDIDKRNLVPILPDVIGPTIDLYYIYPKAIKNSKKVLLLGEFLQSCIPEEHKIRERVVHKEGS
jgi:DNA-binding transcriptional LysR family regulator